MKFNPLLFVVAAVVVPASADHTDYHNFPAKDSKEEAMKTCEKYVAKYVPDATCSAEECKEPTQAGKWCWRYEEPEERRHLRGAQN